MEKIDFKKNFIDGELNIPSFGHYRIEKEGGKIVVYNEFDRKNTEQTFSDFESFYNAEIPIGKISDYIKKLSNVYIMSLD